MISPPTLETERLLLRPYNEHDIPELLPLIGTREVAATTLRIAYPYTEQDARAFLELAKERDKLWLAITLRADGRQIGGIRSAPRAATSACRTGLLAGRSLLGSAPLRLLAKCCVIGLKTLGCTVSLRRTSNTIQRPEQF